jgi:hypothetical protein
MSVIYIGRRHAVHVSLAMHTAATAATAATRVEACAVTGQNTTQPELLKCPGFYLLKTLI